MTRLNPKFGVVPRFLTDEELREVFGLTERALRIYRGMPDFPAKDRIANRTDRKAVDLFFDRRLGGSSSQSERKERF